MSPRSRVVVALLAGPAAAMADEVTSAALASASHTRLIFVVTAAAAFVAAGALAICFGVLRRRVPADTFEVDRFLALLGIATNGFFLFVVVFGFGFPPLVLGPSD